MGGLLGPVDDWAGDAWAGVPGNDVVEAGVRDMTVDHTLVKQFDDEPGGGFFDVTGSLFVPGSEPYGPDGEPDSVGNPESDLGSALFESWYGDGSGYETGEPSYRPESPVPDIDPEEWRLILWIGAGLAAAWALGQLFDVQLGGSAA